MGIAATQQSNFRTDYAGYKATGDAKTDAFYGSLSEAVKKAEGAASGDPLGLTSLPYSDMMNYCMTAFYAENSTDKDPVIRIKCNYGGQNRCFDVHVKEVNPCEASQLEMFALACYQDDKGLTDRGTFGSYTRMKAYADNASYLGQGYDLQNPENVNVKMDWISMLQQMSQVYIKNSQTYSQYLDCERLASALDKWNNDSYSKNAEDSDTEFNGKDFKEFMQQKTNEISQKIQSGELEESYQIGGRSFTVKEWDKLLEEFDSIQEAVRELMREEQEKKEEERLEEEMMTPDEKSF